MSVLAAVAVLAAFQTNFSNDGLKALEARQYQAAAEAFSKAIQADPKDFSAHFNLAFAYGMLNKDAEAIAEYQKTLELKPNLYQAELNLGILLLRQKRPAEAMPYLAAAAAERPKEYRPNFYLAEAFREQGEFAKAEQQYATTLQINPAGAGAELGLGETLAQENRLAEAAPHFKRAAELDAHYRDALLELASLFEKANKPDEAIAIYRQFPENPGAQERIGSLLFRMGHYADAVAQYERAVKESPTPANQLALAEAYIKNKEPDKAFPVLQGVVAAQPNDYQVRMLYGRMVRDQRKFPEAAQQFLAAVKLKPDAAEAWSELAGVLLLMDNYSGALAALDKIAALHAEKPGHVYLRAMIFDHLHQLKPALENYQRFLAIDEGKDDNEAFTARQRVRIIESELNRR
jgi:tetratricopeptide (TPR) repeat protein